MSASAGIHGASFSIVIRATKYTAYITRCGCTPKPINILTWHYKVSWDPILPWQTPMHRPCVFLHRAMDKACRVRISVLQVRNTLYVFDVKPAPYTAAAQPHLDGLYSLYMFVTTVRTKWLDVEKRHLDVSPTSLDFVTCETFSASPAPCPALATRSTQRVEETLRWEHAGPGCGARSAGSRQVSYDLCLLMMHAG